MKKIVAIYYNKYGTEYRRYIFDFHNLSHFNTYIGDCLECHRICGKVVGTRVLDECECTIIVNPAYQFVKEHIN